MGKVMRRDIIATLYKMFICEKGRGFCPGLDNSAAGEG